MSQKIQFYYDNPKALDAVVAPRPASQYYPKWFRELANVPNPNNPGLLTAKKCMALVDSFSSGYIFELACDLNIKRVEDNKYGLSWSGDFCPVVSRDGHQTMGFPKFGGFEAPNFAWMCPYGIKTPKGWSVLISHPSNHYELPFLTFSGIVDSDGYGSSGIYPFMLKDEFEGTIYKGTPLFQITPFKRESWKSEIVYDKSIYRDNEVATARSVSEGHYKKNFWQSKSYR